MVDATVVQVQVYWINNEVYFVVNGEIVIVIVFLKNVDIVAVESHCLRHYDSDCC